LAAGWLLSAAMPSLAAQPLRDVLGNLLQESPRMQASVSDQLGAEARTNETFRRAWTPSIDVTGEIGVQRYQTENNSSPDTVNPDRLTFRATQLLYDFGRSGHQISETQAAARQAGSVTGATRDGLLIEALTAHWSVVRSQRVLDYSRQSEASVRNQAKLENSLVELGKGYESNVLQAKVQLASGEARRVRAEGALDIARARIAAVFGKFKDQVAYDLVVVPLNDKLPKTLEDAQAIALENSKQLQVGVHRSQAIRERMSSTSAREFLPRLQAVAEVGRRHDTDTPIEGTEVDDRKLLLQFQYNFNAGMAGRYAVASTQAEYDASVAREVDTRNLVDEQVAISWRNLAVARSNRDTLSNQVRIAAKFLEMATAERQLGRRTLLDVLTAEVSLINALSDLISTEADTATAGLTLLQAIGKLDFDTVQFLPVDQVIPKIGS
jgi:adhesin transport system outer membrane protein